jgi:hypothetical protein
MSYVMLLDRGHAAIAHGVVHVLCALASRTAGRVEGGAASPQEMRWNVPLHGPK